ncbi:TagK domain-containing protein [Burkholderia sp. LMG 32019]|uniref:TagK domain-containing protein n=1 Tax=Burkholderia sp. LMG 32019 TaxID=3158173 RepID=UPI003C308F0E
MNHNDDHNEWRGGDAVFGLIGSAVMSEGSQSSVGPVGAASVADDLIESLNRQYRQALTNPFAVFPAEEWTVPVDTEDLTMPQSDGPDLAQADAKSVEEWLGGAMSIDSAFGPLGTGENLELVAREPTPEILRLFAPKEFQTVESHRVSNLPPPLTRREHHALTVDSSFVPLVRDDSATLVSERDVDLPRESNPPQRSANQSPTLTMHTPFRPPVYGEPS